MLDQDYSARFERLVRQTDYDIELPIDGETFFRQRGQMPTCQNDQRDAQRLKVRTRGLLWFECHPSYSVRSAGPVGIYTRDFSRRGVGILIGSQVFPEDTLRIVLPTFWLRVRVNRVRRVADRCFEVGCGLMQRFDPAAEAFQNKLQNEHPQQTFCFE